MPVFDLVREPSGPAFVRSDEVWSNPETSGSGAGGTILDLEGLLAGPPEGAVAVELGPEDDPCALETRLDALDHVRIRFDAFNDGRGFSAATMLRRRLGYSGRLIATGEVHRDQIAFMARAGFDAFALSEPPDPATLDEIPHVYQPDAAGTETVWLERHRPPRSRGPAGDADPLPDRDETAAETIEQRLASLNDELRGADARNILRVARQREFGERICYVCSFGAESAALLALIAEVDRDFPVLFVDTGMHFQATRQYREELTAFLGLGDVRDIRPDPGALASEDPKKILWQSDPDACCNLRKVLPLAPALKGFDAWITGRKRFHGGARSRLPVFEHDGQRYKVNPLANWSREDVDAFLRGRELPPHPMVAEGYRSIGCWPCTVPGGTGSDIRAGRWNGKEKTECGLHVERRARQWAF